MLDYSLSTNPLGAPRSLKRQLSKMYRGLANDFDYDYKATKEILAAYHSIKSENIFIASGCSEILYNALSALKPRKALIPAPAPGIYFGACKRCGCEVVTYHLSPENEFEIDPDKLIALSAGVDMIILGNPGNPTGQVIRRGDMARILEHCQVKGIYLIIDETYADFAAEDISAARHVEKHANIMILRTLSNYFSQKELRFGYCISCESLTELMKVCQAPGTVNYFALNAFGILLRDAKYIKKTKSWLKNEPKRFYNLLYGVDGITPYKPHANYIFVETERMPAAILRDRLLAADIKVRVCGKMMGTQGQYIRVAIKDAKSNNKFLEKLIKCLL